MKYIPSELDIRTLKNNTKNTMFKRPINKRKKDVGKIKYLGWSKELVSDGNKIRAMCNLYFIVDGLKHFDKKTQKTTRPQYMQIVQIPYKKSYKNRFDSMYEGTPVKVFSSDPSFKYFLAYALNTVNAVVINKKTKKWLGEALTKRPKIRNKNLHKEMNKHMYKLVEFLATKKIAKYVNDETYIGMNKMPVKQFETYNVKTNKKIIDKIYKYTKPLSKTVL